MENEIPQTITDNAGNPVDIPVEGSLGLLALGAAGLFAWRRKKEQAGIKHGFLHTTEQADTDEEA